MMSWPLVYVLAPLAVIIGLALIWRALHHERRHELRNSALTGIVVGISALLLAFLVWYEHLTIIRPPDPVRPQAWSDVGGMISLGPTLPGPVRPRLALDLPGHDLAALLERQGWIARWIVLDGSRGVRPEYQNWIRTHFGKITEKPLGPLGVLQESVCWVRSDLFPFASGRCLSQSVRYTLAASPTDLARTQNGDAVAAAFRHKDRLFALILNAPLPLVPGAQMAYSPEELCLESLSIGNSCAAIELMPTATVSALALKPADRTQAKILREFEIPRIDEVDSSLAIYDEEGPLELALIDDRKNPHACGGVGEKGQITAVKLQRLSENLQRVRGEPDLSDALEVLDEFRNCPSIGILELPAMHVRREQATLRSLLTQMRERPIWITDPESLRSRGRKVDSVRMGWRGVEDTLWVRPGNVIENLALTVLVSKPVPDADLVRVSVSDPSISVQVHRLTPSAFRVSLDRVADAFALRFAPGITANAAQVSTFFMDWTGFATGALIGMIIAGLTSLFQSVVSTPRRARPFYAGTFLAVFSVVFVWVFLSYRTALLPSGTLASVAWIERAYAPRHVFLRDWPETWLDAPVNKLTKLPMNIRDAWARWATLLTTAKSEAQARLATRPGKVSVYQLSRIPQSVRRSAGRVVVWDDPRARNWHFRKNPNYQTWITSWAGLLRKRGTGSVETGTLESVLNSGPQLFVIPDAHFLDAGDSERLQAWVRSGNTLVVSDGPAGNSPSSGSISWLRESGFGQGVVQGYSKIILPNGRQMEISFPHRVVHSASGPEASWFGASQLGSGRVFYAGMAPVNTEAEELFNLLLGGILGDTVMAADTGRVCTSTVLLQPWGAPIDRIRSFAQSLRSRSIPFHWLVDPVSFAKMVPAWEHEFLRDGVVFRDDGSRVNRELADILWSYAHRATRGVQDDLFFVRPRERHFGGAGLEPGPDGAALLAYAMFPSIGGFEESLQAWRGECSYGVTDLRVIDPAWIAAHPSAEALIKVLKLPKTTWVGVAETAGMFEILAHSNPAGHSRRILRDPLNPLAPALLPSGGKNE